MAVISVFSKEDFLKFVERLPPRAYTAVTDEMTYVWLVPVVTSNHRHYIRLDLKEDGTWKEIRIALEDKGIPIIKGHVSFPKNG